MAEEFLKRLNKMDESINQLGDTLKRMITILGTVTEIKSEIRGAKDEILKALSSQPAAAPIQDDHTDEFAKMVVQEVGSVRVFVQQSMETFRNEVVEVLHNMMTSIQEAKVVAPVAAPEAAPVAPKRKAPPPVEEEIHEEEEVSMPPSLPADRALKIADELNVVMSSLKMGCTSGDVMEVMNDAKATIMNIVPSDPIMVKIDKWIGLVGSYPKRNELQARDVIKLKKDLKEEIQKYSLA